VTVSGDVILARVSIFLFYYFAGNKTGREENRNIRTENWSNTIVPQENNPFTGSFSNVFQV
jgi:hypothetical protein